jgi:hypothetical protein
MRSLAAVGSHPLERGQRIAQRLLGAGGIRQGIALARLNLKTAGDSSEIGRSNGAGAEAAALSPSCAGRVLGRGRSQPAAAVQHWRLPAPDAPDRRDARAAMSSSEE